MARDTATGDVRPDDELMRLIVEAYRDEDLGVPLSAVTGRRANRAPTLFVALATVATVTAVVLVVGGSLRPQPEPFQSGALATATESGTASPGTDPTDEQRCAADYQPQDEDPPLPPLRFALAAPDSRLRLLLFADERHIMACALNHDLVDVAGFSRTVVAVKGDETPYTLGGFSWRLGGVDFVGAFGIGKAPPGTTAVEVRFATADPVQAELSDGWWGWLGGEHHINQATEVVITTPSGTTTHPVPRG